jgi:hypothetical protein
LIAQAKHGYYPAPPKAIAGTLRHLKTPDPPPDAKFKREDVDILDPCAGAAKALVQIAEVLGVSWGHVFAAALNASRSAFIAEHHPGGFAVSALSALRRQTSWRSRHGALVGQYADATL